MSQLQVTGEAKIRDIQGPVIANSGVITALDGAASQYVRGDGTLADFPTSTGGGSSVSYYLNGSVNQGTFAGSTYYEMSKTPIIGAGTDFAVSTNGLVAQFITDANDPDLLEVPGGNFNVEFYFSVNNNTGNPTVYAELYKYDGATFTLLGSSVAVPESLNQGTTIAPYYFAIPVGTAALALTDRIAIRIYANVDGRTVTLHTENSHLCQVVTTFSKGMVSLNNLTDQSQFITTGTSGTDFNIVSTGDTHTFNLPVASATNTGKLSNTDWSTFNAKQAALSFTAPLVNTSNTISIPAATSLVDGYLDNLDWVNFNTAYNNMIVSAAVTGTTTKTLTLTQQDAGTITASWTDDNTDAVTSVFGRTGAVVAASGDYTTTQVTEGTNLYFTNLRAQNAITLTTTGTSGAATYSGGTLNIPQYQGVLTNPVTGTGTTNTLPKFTGTSAIGNSNITDTGSLITLGSNSYVNGSLSVGTATASYRVHAVGAANVETIGYFASSGTNIDAELSVAPSGTAYGRFNSTANMLTLAVAGTSRVFLNPSGSLGLGTTSLTGYNLRVSKNITGATASRGIASDGVVQSDVVTAYLFATNSQTAAATFSTDIVHYFGSHGGTGAGSTITSNTAFMTGNLTGTSVFGFRALSSLTGSSTTQGFRGDIAAATNNWNLYMNGTANNYLAGSLGIGSTSLTGYNLRISKNITGNADALGISIDSTIQSDVTTTAQIYKSNVNTAAAAFTLADLMHFWAQQGTIGSTSAVTRQYGFYAHNSLTGAGTNFGFYSNIAAGATNWNFYANGTANNYMAGNLGLGNTGLNNVNLRLGNSITGSTSSFAILNGGTIQSGVTSLAAYNSTSASTVAATFTLTDLHHYRAFSGTFGAGSVVTNQYGFFVDASLTEAANDYGFYGNIGAAANRWNMYMNGTANNYMAGSLGIGTTSFIFGGGTYNLNVNKNVTGSVVAGSVNIAGTIQSDVTSAGIGLNVQTTTAAAAFTLNQLRHISVNQTTLGAGSSVSNQYGIYVDQITNGTSNFGFFGNVPAQTNTWNLYMNGTANNFMAGSLGIGATSLVGRSLSVTKNITGAVTSYGIISNGQIQSDATSSVRLFNSVANTAAASFTLSSLVHYYTEQVAFGAGSAVTNQYGFYAESNLTGATNNYGFFGNIASGTNRWNLYMSGTAANYMAGKLNIGTTSIDTTVQLHLLNSTNGYVGLRLEGSGGYAGSDWTLFASSNPSSSSNDFIGFYNNSTTDSATVGYKAIITKFGTLSLGTITPNASARLQVDSTTQGFLPPRMTAAQRTAIATPATGLMVYQTDGVEGVYVYSGGSWKSLTMV